VPINASIVDLRYRTKQVLQALERRESVSVLYHGKVKGTIIPASPQNLPKVVDTPFFGMRKRDKRPVNEIMRALRGGRYRAL
jgi:antitoxin (DNA-binding transcriptional repressor) of toxin-antitoxin stability system